MNLTTAREIVRRRVNSGNSSVRYTEGDIDDMIRLFGTDFVRRTDCVLDDDTLTITANVNTVDFSALTGFRPEFIRDLRVTLALSDVTAVLVSGAVDSITVNEGGYFATTPTVTFSGGGGSSAAATAVLTSNILTSFTVTNGGSGYTSVPSVLLNGVSSNYLAAEVEPGVRVVDQGFFANRRTAWGWETGVPRIATFDSLTSARILPAPEFTSTLSLKWRPPFSTWTRGVAQVTATISGGAVTGITVQNGGYYATAPTVTFTGGGGTGATATAVIADADAKTITSFTIGAGGSGYTTAPTVLLNGESTEAVTLNIPEDLIEGVIQYGAAVGVQLADIEDIKTNLRLAAYNAHVAECRGKGGTGEPVTRREEAEDDPDFWR